MHKNEVGKIKNHSLIICESPLLYHFDQNFIGILANKISLLFAIYSALLHIKQRLQKKFGLRYDVSEFKSRFYP